MEQRQGGYQSLQGDEEELSSATAVPQRLLGTLAIALATLACFALSLAVPSVRSEEPKWPSTTSLQNWTFQQPPVEMLANGRFTGFTNTFFKREDAAENMLYTDCHGLNPIGEKVPAEFAGLWWMDGNPAPETVASFGHAQWLPGVDECRKTKLNHVSQVEKDSGTLVGPFGDTVPCVGRLILSFWEDRIWAMPDSLIGRTYEATGTAADSHMEFVCGGSIDNFTICKLGASAGPDMNSDLFDRTLDRFRTVGTSAFNMFAEFSMVKVSPDAWIRYSTKTNFPYYLKRIVDCNGNKFYPHWDEFISGGTAKPVFQPDVFGHGGDKRSHVAPVSETLFVRQSTLGTCRKETGGSCRFLGCYSQRNAVCQEHGCVCPADTCAQDGICGGHCNRGVCPPGQCSQSGKCVR